MIRITLNFSNSQTMNTFRQVGRALGTGDRSISRLVSIQDSTPQKKSGHTSMPRAGFEPMIPLFERPKTDGSAIGTSYKESYYTFISF